MLLALNETSVILLTGVYFFAQLSFRFETIPSLIPGIGMHAVPFISSLRRFIGESCLSSLIQCKSRHTGRYSERTKEKSQ